MRILLLTNNLLFERSMQERLHILSHETYCSESLLKPSHLGEVIPISKFFDAVIISETISDFELSSKSETLQQMNLPMFRKCLSHESISDAEIGRTFKENQYYEIHNDCTLEELREALCIQEERKEIRRSKNDSSTETAKVELVDLHLSYKEMKIMLYLHASNGQAVSRKELIEEAWEGKVTNSTLSQLSIAIKKIRKKIDKKNIPGESILTLWGKGYFFEEQLYDYLCFNSD